MRKSRFTETQIIAILRQVESGARIGDAAREHGVSAATIHRWRSKYGGLDASQLKRLKELEDEYRRLKGLVADLTLDKQALKEVLGKKW